jgi:hypothetical protein
MWGPLDPFQCIQLRRHPVFKERAIRVAATFYGYSVRYFRLTLIAEPYSLSNNRGSDRRLLAEMYAEKSVKTQSCSAPWHEGSVDLSVKQFALRIPYEDDVTCYGTV